jgi:hypothetical protein
MAHNEIQFILFPILKLAFDFRVLGYQAETSIHLCELVNKTKDRLNFLI